MVSSAPQMSTPVRLVVATGVVALLAMISGCSNSETTDEAAEPAATEEADESQPIDLEALDLDVDEIITMEPGGFAELPPDMLLIGELLSSHHVLRVMTPGGPLDVFRVVMKLDGSDGPGPEEPQRCLVLVDDQGSTMSCSSLGEGDVEEAELFHGLTSGDDHVAFEFEGPPATTHFIVVHEGRQIAISAIDGLAVLYHQVPGTACPTLPTTIEAWAGEELLLSEVPRPLHC
jgi:hypothetical protein